MNSISIIFLIFLLSIQSSSAIQPSSVINSTNTNFDSGPYSYMYYSDFSGITLDGIISSGEYPNSLNLLDRGGNFVSTLSWAHNNTHISVALTIIGTGWIGLGMGEIGVSMSGSDIIMSSVSGDTVIVKDMKSLNQGKPSEDKDSYIVDSYTAGVQTTNTTVEFVIPMASSDTKGKDHNWTVGETFGFFTAFHEKTDNFGFKHTSHSESLTVKILDSTYIAPTDVAVSILATPNSANTSIFVSIQMSSSNGSFNLSGYSIGIYKKSLFGKALLDVLITDNTGKSEKDISLTVKEEMIIFAILPAQVNTNRDEASTNVSFTVIQEVVTKSYEEGDLRILFGDNMMRDFILTLFLLIILSLVFAYSAVLLDLVEVYKEGRKVETTVVETTELKEETT